LLKYTELALDKVEEKRLKWAKVAEIPFNSTNKYQVEKSITSVFVRLGCSFTPEMNLAG